MTPGQGRTAATALGAVAAVGAAAFAWGALVESPEKSIEFLKGAGEPFGQFGRGAVEDEREKKRGGKSEETHGKDLPFGRR